MPEFISTMNDTKWRRLIKAIADIPLPVSIWKFVNNESEYSRPTPRPDEVLNDVAVGDTSAMGPFYFRDVQSLRWPESYETYFGPNEPLRVFQQPLGELVSAIEAAGKFDIQMTDSGLVLFAYRQIS